MENPNKCLVCGCNITRSNQGITRKNFNYMPFNNDEVICLKCYNKGKEFEDVREVKK